MSRNKQIVICTSDNHKEATVVNALLEKNGITSVLRKVTVDSLLTRKPEPVMVEIDEKDYNDAKIILKQ